METMQNMKTSMKNQQHGSNIEMLTKYVT